MDIDERKIGEWPNVALVPGTHIHAATGEYVEQPENTRIGRSRGADGPQAAEPEPEHAGAGSGVQDGAECVDTREKLEADVDRMVKEHGLYWLRTYIIEWLDRQAAITERGCEHVREALDYYSERYAEMDAEIVKLTAERDKLNEDCSSLDKCCNALEEELKRVRAERNICRWNLGELENNIGREIAELLDENGVIEVFKEPLGKRRLITETQRQLEKQVAELTAERDELLKDLDHALACPDCDCCGWQAERDELKAEVEAQRKRANDAERGVLSEEWYVCRDRYEDDIAELTAERDELQRQLLDNIDTDMAIENTQLHCEVNDLLEERDSLREKNSNQRRQLSELQDAIHERNEGVLKRQWQRRIDELTAERNEWQRTAEDYQNCYDMAVKRGQNRLSKIDELTAERDYWKDQMCRCLKYVTSGYAPDILKWPRDERKFCDPCLLVIDAADNLRDVVIQQAESFKKLEAELKAADDTANTLRASVAGLKETVENQKVEILRLKDENAELCMKVHGAPF